MNPKTWRRSIATACILIGAVLLWLSPDQLLGVMTVGAGLALEAIGLRIDHV